VGAAVETGSLMSWDHPTADEWDDLMFDPEVFYHPQPEPAS
jgi:hypothetical protein